LQQTYHLNQNSTLIAVPEADIHKKHGHD
jgi:hypothetical protein